MLTKEQIQKEIEEMDSYLPVSKIEEALGMPPTTLQKVLKGTRTLPKKWQKPLEAYFVREPEKTKEVPLTKKEGTHKSENKPQALSPFLLSRQKLKNGGK